MDPTDSETNKENQLISISTFETLKKQVSSLSEKNDILQAELGRYKVDQIAWDDERRHLTRETELKDDKLSDLERDLRVSKDAEAKALQRYSRALEYASELEREKSELTAECVVLRTDRQVVYGSEDEEVVGELRRRNGQLEGEMEGMRKRVEELEREVDGIVEEKDRRIVGLEKEKEELIGLFKRVGESLVRLEGDVISGLCLGVEKGGDFLGLNVGKVLSEVGDQDDVCGGGGVEKDVVFDSHVNDPKCALTPATEYNGATRRPLALEQQLSTEDGANCDKKTLHLPVINIDSDDDKDVIPPHHNGLKRKIELAESLIKIPDDDDCRDGSLSREHNTKKLKGGQDETPKHEQSVAACGNDYKFSTDQRQTLSAIRKFEETPSSTQKAPNSHDPIDDSGTFQRSSKTKTLLSPHLKEFMVKCQEKLRQKSLECVADINFACKKDPEFCCKAVCALYRQHHAQTTSANDSSCSGSKGFEDCDIDRGTTLAKFLIDGNDKFDMKKSVDELKHHDPRGLDDCRRLACYYSEQLFEIFKNNMDPFFSPLTTGMQYK